MVNGRIISQHFQIIVQLFEIYEKFICKKYNLSQTELNILIFLHNNPEKDTAKDIVELRKIPKANVSKGVESLIQNSMLQRSPDTKDRRRIHLILTTSALNIMPDVSSMIDTFANQLFRGFTIEEKELYIDMNARIAQNVENKLERYNSYNEISKQ